MSKEHVSFRTPSPVNGSLERPRSTSPEAKRLPDMSRIESLYSAGKKKERERREPARNVLKARTPKYIDESPGVRRGKVYPVEDEKLDRLATPRTEHFQFRRSPSPDVAFMRHEPHRPSPTRRRTTSPRSSTFRPSPAPPPMDYAKFDEDVNIDGLPWTDSDADEEEYPMLTARSGYTGYTPREDTVLSHLRHRKEIMLDMDQVIKLDPNLWRPLKNNADEQAFLRNARLAWSRYRRNGESEYGCAPDVPVTIVRTHILETLSSTGAHATVIRLRLESQAPANPDGTAGNRRLGAVFVVRVGHRGLPGLPKEKPVDPGLNGLTGRDPLTERHRNPRNEVNHGFGTPDKQWRIGYEIWKEECGWCQAKHRPHKMERHKETCRRRPVKCQLCNEAYPHDDANEHKAVCLSELEKCGFCHEEMKRGEIEEHKVTTCSHRREPCPLCHDPVDIARREEHNGECLFVETTCEFCHAHLLRGELENHQICECPTATATCGLCGDVLKAAQFNHHLAYECRERLLECAYCKQPYHVSEEQTHPVVCPKMPVPCTYCTEKFRRERIPHHEANECPSRPIHCPLECGKKIKAGEVARHISAECALRPQECQYCFVDVLASRMDVHFEECPQYPCECRWCGAAFLRAVCLEHEEECTLRKEVCRDCGEHVQATQEAVDRHYLEECQLRIVECPHCHKEMEAEILEKTHPATCANWPETCSMCQQPVSTSYLAEHQAFDCPDRPVNCGLCMTSVKAKDHLEHVDNCQGVGLTDSPVSTPRTPRSGAASMGRSPSTFRPPATAATSSVASPSVGGGSTAGGSTVGGEFFRDDVSSSSQVAPSSPRSVRSTTPSDAVSNGARTPGGVTRQSSRASASPAAMGRQQSARGSRVNGGGLMATSAGSRMAGQPVSPMGSRIGQGGGLAGTRQESRVLTAHPSLAAVGMSDVMMMRRAFAWFDKDKSSIISRGEFRERAFQMGLNQEEVTNAFEAVDEDEDGCLSEEEFFKWWKRVDPRDRPAKIRPSEKLMRNVKISMLRADKRRAEAEAEAEGIPCNQCRVRFPTQEEVAAHMPDCPMRVVTCKQCSFNFHAKSMAAHLKRHALVTKVEESLNAVDPVVGLEVNPEMQDYAEVMSVDPGSPAEFAGIKVGDRITMWGSIPVKDLDDFKEAFEIVTKPGAAMHVEFVTDEGTGTAKSVTVEIGAKGVPVEKAAKMTELLRKWNEDMNSWKRNPPLQQP